MGGANRHFALLQWVYELGETDSMDDIMLRESFSHHVTFPGGHVAPAPVTSAMGESMCGELLRQVSSGSGNICPPIRVQVDEGIETERIPDD